LPSAVLENSTSYSDFDWFVRNIFSSFLRADQRRWAEVYLRGLLCVDGKKTIRKIAESGLADSLLGAIQSLQQFISQSPWDWNPVREALARIAYEQVAPQAWILSAAIMPKRGVHSVGVTRRFVHPEGRTINCQRGFGVFLATSCGALPVDWCLELDDVWINEPERRERTKVPEGVYRKAPSDYMLEMVDRLSCDWRLPVVPIVSEFRFSRRDALRLITGLADRKLHFLLEVPTSFAALVDARSVETRAESHSVSGRFHEFGVVSVMQSQYAERGRPGDDVKRSVLSPVSGFHGARATAAGTIPALRLFSGWTGRRRRLWATNLSVRRLDKLLALAQLHRQGAADVQEMQESFGLRDFEGRSYPGWHHHTTLVSAAFAYHRMASGGDLHPRADSTFRRDLLRSGVREPVR
jgi:DDE superfamily endonuclease